MQIKADMMAEHSKKRGVEGKQTKIPITEKTKLIFLKLSCVFPLNTVSISSYKTETGICDTTWILEDNREKAFLSGF